MLNYPEFWNRTGIISIILYPLSLIFTLLTYLRKSFSKKFKFNFPVICVGNVSVGGTGKTVIVKNLALRYLKNNKKVVVLCKGYGGNYIKTSIIEPNHNTSFAGDEAIEIAKEIYDKGDIEIIISKTPKDAEYQINQIKPDVIIVDDGLQNPNFHKDIQILMVDGIRGFGNEMIIPSGPLRLELETAIKDADIIASIDPSVDVQKRIIEISKEIPEFLESRIKFPSQKNSKIFAFCGIGNPKKFFNKLSQEFQLIGTMSFPDHHKYNLKDINKIINQAAKNNANLIVTTKKDIVKIEEFREAKDIIAAEMILNEKDINNIIEKIDAKIKI